MSPSNPLERQPSAPAGRRVTAGAAGVSLVFAVLFTAYHTSQRVYYDYYFYPQVKEHYIRPDGRQRLMDVIFLVGVILLLYLAYRLLRYAFRGRPVGIV
jgi:hypothetical protein